MVATAFPAATEAGHAMLAAGGNAIDAAVAAAWALAVCEPAGSGLGGQTVALIHLANGRTVAVDGHSHAPASVSRKLVSRSEQNVGHRSCTIPTTPAALAHLQGHYGVLPAAQVLEPAVGLAEVGYRISRLQRRQLRWCRKSLSNTPAARAIFFPEDGPRKAGEVLRQPKLAAALQRIADYGAEDFYHGKIARAIVEDMRRRGGLLNAEDLARFDGPAERDPLRLRYGAHEVLTCPPPGGGRELLFALGLLGSCERDEMMWYRAVAEATHAAFSERERPSSRRRDSIGDPREWLQSDAVVGTRAVKRTPAVTTAAGVATEEPGETTHLCTADSLGNVVSLTQSLQSLFGAKVVNPRYGFLYNNYLTTCPRRPHPYRLRGGCRVRSNAAPTLVLTSRPRPSPNGDGRRGRPLLALGAAGSRRIVSSLLCVLSSVLDRDMSVEDAVLAPRVHARLSGSVWLEEPAHTPELHDDLEQRGFTVEVKPALSYCMGAVQAIRFAQDGALIGAADARRDGAVSGLSGTDVAKST
jgi:gamma-glutamyltranspeptidase/glutathione hydrolase